MDLTISDTLRMTVSAVQPLREKALDCMGESIEGTVKGSKMVLYEGDNKLILDYSRNSI